ncbi:hypothetical protein [uncultured Muribaculum sp.]|uniref:hypothetical protein n=1 Tax=uncultured Muribaculum sp. TaxID=1918613 RepID=UPI0025B09381|nr:hypothetical protein [uncultured Muribaculum sp.]
MTKICYNNVNSAIKDFPTEPQNHRTTPQGSFIELIKERPDTDFTLVSGRFFMSMLNYFELTL